MYYGMAAYYGFNRSDYGLNWVDAWIQMTNSNFDWLKSPASYDVIVRPRSASIQLKLPDLDTP